jgi:hypothetical protein
MSATAKGVCLSGRLLSRNAAAPVHPSGLGREQDRVCLSVWAENWTASVCLSVWAENWTASVCQVWAENWTASGADFCVPDAQTRALEVRHHVVAPIPFGAVNQLILRDPETGVLTAVSDPRKDGAPAAF